MLWADLERVNSIAFFLVPETCQSERGFRLWPKRPAWGRNVQEPKRHVHVPKRPYINLASWFVGELVIGDLNCWQVGLSASCPVTIVSPVQKCLSVVRYSAVSTL